MGDDCKHEWAPDISYGMTIARCARCGVPSACDTRAMCEILTERDALRAELASIRTAATDGFPILEAIMAVQTKDLLKTLAERDTLRAANARLTAERDEIQNALTLLQKGAPAMGHENERPTAEVERLRQAMLAFIDCGHEDYTHGGVYSQCEYELLCEYGPLCKALEGGQ